MRSKWDAMNKQEKNALIAAAEEGKLVKNTGFVKLVRSFLKSDKEVSWGTKSFLLWLVTAPPFSVLCSPIIAQLQTGLWTLRGEKEI